MNPDAEIAQLVASLKCGSVVAAAGCGKTEQIARATQIAEGRRLILTHTHAGVDALRARLKTHKVSSEKFRVDTIAGWCLRYAASFPKRSSLTCANPRSDKEWNAVYEAAARLIQSGAVKGVLASSYAGGFPRTPLLGASAPSVCPSRSRFDPLPSSLAPDGCFAKAAFHASTRFALGLLLSKTQSCRLSLPSQG